MSPSVQMVECRRLQWLGRQTQGMCTEFMCSGNGHL